LDLRLSRRAAPSSWLVDQLQQWRIYKMDWQPGKNDDYFIELDGVGTFRLAPRSRVPYEFTLISETLGDIRVWNPDRWGKSGDTGQIYLSFRSVYLQRFGIEGVRSVLASLEALLFDHVVRLPDALSQLPTYTKVSRSDLAVDVAEDGPMTFGELDRTVGRSRKRETFTTLINAEASELRELAKKCVQGDFKPAHKSLESGSPQLSNKGGANLIGPAAAAAASAISAVAQACLVELERMGQASLTRSVGDGRTPATFYYGRFAGELYARRYNKLGTLATQGKLYMLDLWLANGWDGLQPVHRTEFSLAGDFLKNTAHTFLVMTDDLAATLGKSGGLQELDNFLAFLPELWRYLTHDWLRICDPTEDKSNPDRWPASDLWQAVQSVWFSVGELKRSRPVRKPEDAQLLAQGVGVLLSAAVHREFAEGGQGGPYCRLSDRQVVHPAWDSILDDLDAFAHSDDYLTAWDTRAKSYGFDFFSDAQFSAQVRADRMLEGRGS
jgi:hypothetical protein